MPLPALPLPALLLLAVDGALDDDPPPKSLLNTPTIVVGTTSSLSSLNAPSSDDGSSDLSSFDLSSLEFFALSFLASLLSSRLFERLDCRESPLSSLRCCLAPLLPEDSESVRLEADELEPPPPDRSVAACARQPEPNPELASELDDLPGVSFAED